MTAGFEQVRVIGLDADDTLWHSENQFHAAHQEYRSLLVPFVDCSDETLDTHMLATERRNLAIFGYGVKGFVLSLIETAIEITDGDVDATTIQAVIDLGKSVLRHPVDLLDGVAETITTLLDRGYELALITKGDLLHQESKIAASGLADLMRTIDIVSDKTPAVYESILDRNGIAPAEFCMIGNSVKSDIVPCLTIGTSAIHVPYEYLWAHEAHDPPAADSRFAVAERFADIAELLVSPAIV